MNEDYPPFITLEVGQYSSGEYLLDLARVKEVEVTPLASQMFFNERFLINRHPEKQDFTLVRPRDFGVRKATRYEEILRELSREYMGRCASEVGVHLAVALRAGALKLPSARYYIVMEELHFLQESSLPGLRHNYAVFVVDSTQPEAIRLDAIRWYGLSLTKPFLSPDVFLVFKLK